MFDLPKREFPKVMAGEGECQICGMPLKDSKCPMCGWGPKIEDEDSLRCPFCNSQLVNYDRCPDCGRNMAELEEERQEVESVTKCACPKCLKEIGLENEACPHCGARIWFDVAEELKALRVTRCPKCQSQVSENMELCPNCGFEIWIGSEEGLKNAVMDIIDEAKKELSSGKEEGTELFKFHSVLEEAEKKFELGRYRRAELLAKLVVEGAKTMTLQFKMYKDGLRKAERLLDQIGEFSERAEVKKILESARRMADEGNYKKALRLAIRASIIAEKLKGDRPLSVAGDYK